MVESQCGWPSSYTESCQSLSEPRIAACSECALGWDCCHKLKVHVHVLKETPTCKSTYMQNARKQRHAWLLLTDECVCVRTNVLQSLRLESCISSQEHESTCAHNTSDLDNRLDHV